jgi:NagD protein
MNGMGTILVLTGVTRRGEIHRYPYQPRYIYESVADIPMEFEDDIDV